MTTETATLMAEMLTSHGDCFSGNNVDDQAQDWIDHDFVCDSANDWCEAGVWDAATAAALRDAGLTPQQATAASERLVDDMDDEAREAEYTDGDPIYSACNGDTDIQLLIDAAQG